MPYPSRSFGLSLGEESFSCSVSLSDDKEVDEGDRLGESRGLPAVLGAEDDAEESTVTFLLNAGPEGKAVVVDMFVGDQKGRMVGINKRKSGTTDACPKE